MVTDIYFDFGTVPVGFQSVANPTLSVMVKGMAVNGYQMVNRADAGGQVSGYLADRNSQLDHHCPQDRHYPETAQDGILTTERRQPALRWLPPAIYKLCFNHCAEIDLMSTVVRTRWLSLLHDSQN